MKTLVVLFGLLLSVSASSAAYADSFTFTFTSQNHSGSGTFGAQLQSSNQYLIGSISGSVLTASDGLQTISSLLPACPDPQTACPQSFDNNDNLLFNPPSPGYFDLNGVSFLLADGAKVNLSYDLSNGYFVDFMDNNGQNAEAASVFVNAVPVAPPITSVATPEPSSLMLLGTGALGMIGTLRRRFVR